MKVRMLADRTGTRYDGQDWPGRGGEFTVPDEEAEFLIENGIAEKASGAAGGPSSPAAAAPEGRKTAAKARSGS
jgi:hypothetical protein